MIEPRSRGVLDPRVRGDDSGVRSVLLGATPALTHAQLVRQMLSP